MLIEFQEVKQGDIISFRVLDRKMPARVLVLSFLGNRMIAGEKVNKKGERTGKRCAYVLPTYVEKEGEI